MLYFCTKCAVEHDSSSGPLSAKCTDGQRHSFSPILVIAARRLYYCDGCAVEHDSADGFKKTLCGDQPHHFSPLVLSSQQTGSSLPTAATTVSHLPPNEASETVPDATPFVMKAKGYTTSLIDTEHSYIGVKKPDTKRDYYRLHCAFPGCEAQ